MLYSTTTQKYNRSRSCGGETDVYRLFAADGEVGGAHEPRLLLLRTGPWMMSPLLRLIQLKERRLTHRTC